MESFERWAPVPGFESVYEVGECGNVRSLHGRKAIVLRPGKMKNGYLLVSLSAGGKSKSFLVHRLVALCFIKNDHNLPCVNHIDGDKENNNAANLEWCSHAQNNLHAYRVLGKKAARSTLGKFDEKHPNAKPVVAIDLKSGMPHFFPTQTKAARVLNRKQGAVGGALRERRNYFGFAWFYDDALSL